jgi:hypothetical protein
MLDISYQLLKELSLFVCGKIILWECRCWTIWFSKERERIFMPMYPLASPRYPSIYIFISFSFNDLINMKSVRSGMGSHTHLCLLPQLEKRCYILLNIINSPSSATKDDRIFVGVVKMFDRQYWVGESKCPL